MGLLQSKPKQTALERLKSKSLEATNIFDKVVKDLSDANTDAVIEKNIREKEIERLNLEISEINSIEETNTKVINRINSIFKDED